MPSFVPFTFSPKILKTVLFRIFHFFSGNLSFTYVTSFQKVLFSYISGNHAETFQYSILSTNRVLVSPVCQRLQIIGRSFPMLTSPCNLRLQAHCIPSSSTLLSCLQNRNNSPSRIARLYTFWQDDLGPYTTSCSTLYIIRQMYAVF